MTTTDNTLTLTQGNISVDILIVGSNGIKQRWDKLVTPIDVPKQATPYSILIDLKKLRETITVQGYLLDEQSSSMWTKRYNLRTMFQTVSTIYFKWDRNDPAQWLDANNNPTGQVGVGTWLGYPGDILVGEVNENPEGIGDSEDTKSLAVTIQFIVGRIKG